MTGKDAMRQEPHAPNIGGLWELISPPRARGCPESVLTVLRNLKTVNDLNPDLSVLRAVVETVRTAFSKPPARAKLADTFPTENAGQFNFSRQNWLWITTHFPNNAAL